MKLFPAIDLYDGKAVRLYKGDYARMTVYHNDPLAVATDFRAQGASCLHMVDLEGARDGTTPNLSIITAVKKATGLFTEVGGGIRTMETVRTYLESGIDRVILGTAAVKDPAFLQAALTAYGSRIAVGVDIRDGEVSVHGWTESSGLEAFSFLHAMEQAGVATVICTDISRDGAMKGTNRELYRRMARELKMDLIASGGVSTLEDIRAMAGLGLYGTIIGKAYYTGAVRLQDALAIARGEEQP